MSMPHVTGDAKSVFRHLVLFSGVIFIIAAISVKIDYEYDSNLGSNKHFLAILCTTPCFPGKVINWFCYNSDL